ncbi:MAG TPA: hypothetical protein VGD60_04060 [Candidatus Acidoferrales bacterium]
MRNENTHPSDQELLMRADGELPRGAVAAVDAHLTACWNCRARMAEVEAKIAEFVRVRREGLDPTLPPSAGSRAMLAAQMAELSKAAPRRMRWKTASFFADWRFTAACAVAVVLLAVALAGLKRENQVAVASAYGAELPDRRLTPGATRQVAIGEICAVNHEDVVSLVPDTVRHEVFQEYGIRNAPADKYEVDYLIAPGLGGAEDIRNLWPEPRFDATWSSFVKDQLEEYLHESVCGGKLSLQTAQNDEARDWIAAYQKYFHTREPLAGDSKASAQRAAWILEPWASVLKL